MMDLHYELKEEVVIIHDVTSQNLAEGTEENSENRQSGLPISESRIKPGTFLMPCDSAIPLPESSITGIKNELK
jgi:hypothetical protein